MKDEDISYALDGVDSGSDDAVSVNSDNALLMSMGKKPELKRVYNFWTCEYRPGGGTTASWLRWLTSASVRVSDYDLL